MVKIPVLENHGSNIKGYQSGAIRFHLKPESEKFQKFQKFLLLERFYHFQQEKKKSAQQNLTKNTPKETKSKKAEAEKLG